MSPASWLVAHLARLLDADERDAVLGDLAELGASQTQVIREIVGLATRRQFAPWKGWRPWLALLGLALPLGMALSFASRAWANNSAIYAWFYVNNWTWGYLQSPGARLDLLRYSGTVIVRCLALIGWAWTIGFVLASLSRRAVWATAGAFTVVLFVATYDSTTSGLANSGNWAVFASPFYRLVFPALVRATLVLPPMCLGAMRAPKGNPLSPAHALLCAGAVGAATWLTAPGVESALIYGWWSSTAQGPVIRAFADHHRPWPLHLLPLLLMLPVACIFLQSVLSSRQASPPRKLHG
ncbi:MAG: hypothetical protein KGN76_18485 [Acidobacteriota bacterium]|nr:hypothetical protein [Acidobacteriota bacterium]